MNMKKLLKSKRRGSALPLAVVAVIILLAMGVGLLSLGFNSRVYSIRTASDIAARCAADAGLTMALFEMNEKLQVKPFKEGTLPEAMAVKLPYSDQVCNYRVTGNLAGGYTIWSLGESDRARRSVRATIGLKGAFDHAILTKQTLTLKSGTTIDGYNSKDPFDADIDIAIGSQSASDSSLVLNSGVIVNGDVFAGGNLDSAIKDLGAKITGEKYTGEQVDFPKVYAPTMDNKGAISATGETVKITSADSGTYTSIDLQQLITKEKGVTTTTIGVLEIEGDVVLHVTGDIKLGNSCEIVVTKDSSLTIYSDGNINCNNGSGVNTQNPPEKAETFQLYATGTEPQYFDIKAKSEFTGVIYAPDADVDLYAKGDAYGSIIAHDFEFKAGGNFYYDEALKKKNDADDEAVQFVVERWYESPPFMSASDIQPGILDAVPIQILK